MSAMSKMYDMGPEERRAMGLAGKKHVEKNYNFETFKTTWVDFIDTIYEKEGSWETRKNINNIRFMEVA